MTYPMYRSGFSPLGRHQPHAANGISNGKVTYTAQFVAADHEDPVEWNTTATAA